MGECQNCGKKLHAYNEAYGLTGRSSELCLNCRMALTKAIRGYELTEEFIDLHKNELLSKGVTESGIEHIRKAIDEKAEEKKKDERTHKEEQEQVQKRAAALSGILISSGFSFDGYRIVKYSGYISGDDAIQINRDDLFKNNGQHLTDCLVLIRAQALKELKEAAYDLGCNAVIGVDFDYMTFEPETVGGTMHFYEPYVVCVTANGNAVIIEQDS